MKEHMNFTKEMVTDYADKLLIGLTEEETNMVLEEFSIIDENINKINNIKDIEKVEPMTHCLDNFIYDLREDVEEESIPIEELLQNCDEHTMREVEVPTVVG
ncbi:MAG: aspartyl/glutamyl-tRNA amidotransferase subunit C [Erysipelotrichaceae bacterium]|nr:aspartyl/glutamyl-tRNA amidotransferase subunit C [Erysipelotrichaceae bacterium]